MTMNDHASRFRIVVDGRSSVVLSTCSRSHHESGVNADLPILVARHAMATRFEIVLHGADPARLRAAGEEALDEIERVEAQLSLYRPSSEIARLNATAHERPVRVTPSLFALLHRARALSVESDGAFDITVAPLVRCWGFMGGAGAMPDAGVVAAARACVGMHLVELNEEALSVRFARPGVMLDFGAIGKGYGVERAAELLREAGVTSALLHGGTSTAVAIGRQPDGARWKIAITSAANDESNPIAVVELENESLSVSAVWGRAFTSGQKRYGHIIDPRTGEPAAHALLSAVVTPSATDGDALSTALLTAPELMSALVARRADFGCLVVTGTESNPDVRGHGITCRDARPTSETPPSTPSTHS
jgi:FAD:protein FMN transferase